MRIFIMDLAFQNLIDTTSLWLPALTWLIGQASASQTGRNLTHAIKSRLKWIKEPEAEKAFHEAFGTGIKRYEQKRGNDIVAQALALVMTHIAKHDVARLDRETILYQIFSKEPDPESITKVTKRHMGAIVGIEKTSSISLEDITNELQILIVDFLRPAFRENRFFTERVGFAEIIGLLEEINHAITQPKADLERLRIQYCTKIRELYDDITMQGISPKVQNRTIGIKMQSVFIPLKANFEDLQALKALIDKVAERNTTSEFTISHTNSKTRINLPEWLELSEEERIRYLHDLFNEVHVPVTRYVMGVDSFLDASRIVLQGDPGSGKSTVTRFLAWKAANFSSSISSETVDYRVPIRIRAIEFGEQLDRARVDTFDEYLIEKAGRFGPLIANLLITGRAMILIDGLDEVGKLDLRLRVKEYIENFIADPIYSDNQMLITTRVVGYERNGLIGRFPHYRLAELDNDQIEDFIGNWYTAIYEEIPDAIDVDVASEQLLRVLKQNSSIGRMAQNPLLLTIIALLNWQEGSLPDRRVLLYDAATQTLIRSWPLRHRGVELDEYLIREWLAPIAFFTFSDGSSDLINEFSLMEKLVESMQNLKPLTKFEARRESETLLEAVSLHSGILLPRGTDEDGRNLYGFLHQTFSEYLTAYYLAEKWENQEINLLQYAHDPYWREVILLMAGHLGIQYRKKAGRFLKDILQLKSSPYEDYLQRDLILAGIILADGVPVGPGNLVMSLLTDLLQLWITTPFKDLWSTIKYDIFKPLSETKYALTLAQLAIDNKLNPEQIIELGEVIGDQHFSKQLSDLLNHPDSELCLQSARLLKRRNDKHYLNSLSRLLNDADSNIRLDAARLIIEEDLEESIKKAEDVLVDLSCCENEKVRRGALWTLASQQNEHGLKAIETLLDSTNNSIGQNVHGLIVRENWGAKRIRETLQHLFESENQNVRRQSLRLLA